MCVLDNVAEVPANERCGCRSRVDSMRDLLGRQLLVADFEGGIPRTRTLLGEDVI